MSLQADAVLNALVAGIEAVTLDSSGASYAAYPTFKRVTDQRNVATIPPPRGFTLSVSRGLRNTESNSVGAPELELAVQAVFTYPDTGDTMATQARILGDQNALLQDLPYTPGGTGKAAMNAMLGADAGKISLLNAASQAATLVAFDGQQGFFEAVIDFTLTYTSV